LHLINAFSTYTLLMPCGKKCSYHLREFNTFTEHSVDNEEIFDVLMFYTRRWI